MREKSKCSSKPCAVKLDLQLLRNGRTVGQSGPTGHRRRRRVKVQPHQLQGLGVRDVQDQPSQMLIVGGTCRPGVEGIQIPHRLHNRAGVAGPNGCNK
jgi:hypothetical protein